MDTGRAGRLARLIIVQQRDFIQRAVANGLVWRNPLLGALFSKNGGIRLKLMNWLRTFRLIFLFFIFSGHKQMK